MRRVEGLSLLAEFEDGDYFSWEDGGWWLSVLGCSDEVVGSLSLDGNRLIRLGFYVRFKLYLLILQRVKCLLILC